MIFFGVENIKRTIINVIPSCSAKTKKGTDCKRSGVYTDGRCHHHTNTHEKKPKVKLKKQRSKGERQVYQAFMLTPLKYLGPFKENVRPNFLRNPETGRNLELDFFFEEDKVAIDMMVVSITNMCLISIGWKKDFVAQQSRDRFKDDVCHFREST